MLIDTHRHLGGSLPVSFVWETIKEKNLHWLAESLDDVTAQMTFSEHEPRDFHRFLDKFRILDEITWDEELIDRSIAAICGELEREKLDYCWLDFSINKYMQIGWHKKDAIQFIYESFDTHRPGRVGLILSLKYESMQASQRQYASLIDDPSLVDLLFGLDLVGDENRYEKEFYKPILQSWRQANKMVRAHVGESGSAENVESAISSGCTNIAHGIKVLHKPEAVAMARDIGICFDVAPTSNLLTGVVTSVEYHPMTLMIHSGLQLTIGSDDPVPCATSLQQEFEIAKSYGVSEKAVEKMKQKAIGMTKQFTTLPNSLGSSTSQSLKP